MTLDAPPPPPPPDDAVIDFDLLVDVDVGGDLLFDDLDFDDVDVLDNDGGGNALDTTTTGTDTIMMQHPPPVKRTRGILTSKGPPPIFFNDKDNDKNKKKGGTPSKKKKRNSTSTNDNDNDDDNPDHRFPSRGRSKRKKKPIVMYTDSDDTTFTKDLKKKNSSRLQKSGTNDDAHSMNVLSGTSPRSLSSTIHPLSKNSRSSIISSTANVFSTSIDPLSKSGVVSTGSTGANEVTTKTTATNQKKTGRIQRSLPTQRKRKASAITSSVLNDLGTTTASSSTSFSKKKIDTTSIVSSASKALSSSHPTSSTPLKKKNKTFFPFTSIPTSCLTGKNQRVLFGKLSNLHKIYQGLHSSNGISDGGSDSGSYTNSSTMKKKASAKDTILAQLLVKRIFSSTSSSSSSSSLLDKNIHQSHKFLPSSRPTGQMIDGQSIISTKKMIASMNKKTLISELRKLQQQIHNQSKFITKGMVHLGSWSNRKFANNNPSTSKSSKSSDKKQGSSLASSSPSKSTKQSPSFCSTILSKSKNQSNQDYILPEIIDTVFNAPYPQSSKSKPTMPITVKVKCKHEKSRSIHGVIIPRKSPIGLSFLLSKPLPSSVSMTLVGIAGSLSSSPSKQALQSPLGKKRKPNYTSTTSSNDTKDKSGAVKKQLGKKMSQSTIKKDYEQMNPRKKLDYLKQVLSQRARYVEQLMFKARVEGEQRLKRRDNERHRLINANDIHVYMNTTTLFGVMDNMPYWDDINPMNISAALSLIRQPEISPLEMYWSGDVIPVVSIQDEKQEGQDRQREKRMLYDSNATDEGINEFINPEEINVSSYSLFDRLQSMLVDVGESSDDEYDNYDLSDVEECNIIDIENADGISDNCEENILDVSRLTLDQRAYIHLRSIHLIDQTTLPSFQPNVIEMDITNDDLGDMNDVGDHEQHGNSDNGHNTLEDHIQRLKYELYNQHCKTNEIAANLQLGSNEEMMQLSRKREKMDEDNHIIWKHSQLLGKMKKKRDGENKTRNKMNDKDQSVPW